MFAIVLTYLASPQERPEVLAAHRAWADAGVARGVIVLTGPQRGGAGGFMLAHGIDRDGLDRLIAEDPFHRHGIARHDVIEVAPRTGDERLSFLFAR
jgi:uncharacterized protein YciI